ncbi:Probable Co/Zn/Cd efflux system membrane fusion protein [hydrothermal vent metagenome]|uniref:Probable Co/Zn/Cd efflux system membrane fusion protein n=1 Tax=hydrothermal vent metagenome TaxID=652676 RepID=A0A3B1CL60_9ZZZZ
MNRFFRLIPLLCLILVAPVFAEEAEEADGIPQMSAAEREAMGILTQRVETQLMAEVVTAPGEVRLNRYRSAEVGPRITAQIIHRHARMGQIIQKGQKLVTLSSVEMAEAQGELLISDREWRRVKDLGRKVVSEKRYVSAQVTRQQAYAKVLAFGMTESQVTALLKQGDVSHARGIFDLLSPQAGTVISDDFVTGRVVPPGTVLMEISDESRLWVEAKLSPEVAVKIKLMNPARVSSDQKNWLSGKVVQIHRRIDETTRTLAIRIEVDSQDQSLRPGQFVRSLIQVSAGEAVLAVPKEALVLLSGADAVFKVEGDEIQIAPVERGETHGNWTEIKAGLRIGNEIVTQGAYVLKSLLLKSQIGDSD